jgi:pimeloyl-ACP methyl ester carboxylesterase
VSAPPGTPLLIFLPGGMIDANAYVPLARGLADRGVPIAIVELPWRSAPTERARRQLWGRIESARERWGQGRPIVIAGHSRGGALAARFVAERAQPAGTPLGGLILMGTTHPRDHDLSGVSFPVLRIVASEDCVASPSAARANATRLPPETNWVAIDGGNHRQFGYYGWQIGDCAATISREEQHRQVIEAVTGFLSMARLDSGD